MTLLTRLCLWSALTCALTAAPPSIRVLTAPSPAAGSSVAVRGVASSQSPIEHIYWLDQRGHRGPVSFQVANVTEWSAELPLTPGVNQFAIVVVDAEGQAATTHFVQHNPTQSGPQVSELRPGTWMGQAVTYSVIDGWNIVEGDIIAGRATPGPFGLTTASTAQLWPLVGGVRKVPYTIANGSSNTTAAISYVNTALTGILQWVPQTTETNYVTFNLDPGNLSGSCQSSVGMVGGQQFIQGSVNCGVDTMAHEMGHAIGLLHEHQRADRNTWITINTANADKPFVAGNIDPATLNAQTVGLYDHASLMHYGAFNFTKNGLAVIESKPAGIPLSNSTGYTPGDIDQIRRLYGATPSTVTITTNPPGLKIAVDGVVYTAPKTFSWALNSTHQLNLPADPQQTTPADGSKYQFAKWNDGGTRAHAIAIGGGTGSLVSPAAKPAYTVYQANFVRLQPFTISASPAASGAVTVNPVPQSIYGGTYFVDRQQVTATATPNGGQNFFGWFGLPYPQGGTPYPFAVQSPLTASGNFTTFPVTIVGQSITGPNTHNPGLYAYVDNGFTYLPQGYSQDYSGPSWAAGTTHSVQVDNPEVPITYNATYSFNNWSDSGAATHSITASSSGVKAVTASFTPVYRSYAYAQQFCGDVQYSIACPNNDCSFSDGTLLGMTATPTAGSGMVFAGWTGDLSGLTNPQSTTIHDQFLPVANFNIVPTILKLTAVSPASPVTSPNALALTLTGTGFVNGSFYTYWNGAYRPSTVVSSTQATMQLSAGDLSATGGQQLDIGNYTASCGAVASATVIVKKSPGTPRLGITKSHTGNFTRGGAGVYTLTVKNAATATGPTSGTVTVTDTIPTGLTLVSLSGTGWTCTANTCTRSNALAVNQSYPAITVNVTVSPTAPASVTNTASVSGGNSPAASASDPTMIQ
jgi:uncharacterized repeat protein (TIGR01451 family)